MLTRYRHWATAHPGLNHVIAGLLFASLFLGLTSVNEHRSALHFVVLFVFLWAGYGGTTYLMHRRRNRT